MAERPGDSRSSHADPIWETTCLPVWDNPRMPHGINLHRFAALAAVLSVALFGPAAAPGQDGPPVYCSYLDYDRDNSSTTGRVFYSDVFRDGEYSPNVDRWERQFREFLRANYRLFSPYRDAFCFVEDHPGESYSDLESVKRDARLKGNEVIETRWAPGPSSLSGEPTATPLRDIHVAVASGDRTVSVCVRDHECEDGDRVRVSVNGSAVFTGEIAKAWSCRSVRVRAGRNGIELYAINGTGRKGSCSYADENTGQIRVEGLDVDTQEWKHRGGAGSSAAIVVTVR